MKVVKTNDPVPDVAIAVTTLKIPSSLEDEIVMVIAIALDAPGGTVTLIRKEIRNFLNNTDVILSITVICNFPTETLCSK